MPSPGDVVGCWNAGANKHKFHLCVCPTGKFLFINSPKARSYPGDFHVPSPDMPLDPTPEGYSIVSCTAVTLISDAELKRLKAVTKGRVPARVLRDLVKFVESSTILSQEDKEQI